MGPGLIWEVLRPEWVSVDGRRILAARAMRNFAYGFLSVLLGIYLEALGYTAAHVGGVLMATLLGSALLSLLFAAVADRWGRRRVLAASAALQAGYYVRLYGHPHPFGVHAGFAPLASINTGLLGLWLDRDHGLLAPDRRRSQRSSTLAATR